MPPYVLFTDDEESVAARKLSVNIRDINCSFVATFDFGSSASTFDVASLDLSVYNSLDPTKINSYTQSSKTRAVCHARLEPGNGSSKDASEQFASEQFFDRYNNEGMIPTIRVMGDKVKWIYLISPGHFNDCDFLRDREGAQKDGRIHHKENGVTFHLITCRPPKYVSTSSLPCRLFT